MTFITFLPSNPANAIFPGTTYITTFVYYGFGDIDIQRIPVNFLTSLYWDFLYQTINSGYDNNKPYGPWAGLTKYKMVITISNKHVFHKDISCSSLEEVRIPEAFSAISHYYGGNMNRAEYGKAVLYDVYFNDGHQLFYLANKFSWTGTVAMGECIKK